MIGVILAGGMGRRLGEAKPQVEIEGIPLIERVLGVIEPLFEEVLIVGGRDPALNALGVKVLADIIPHKGSLGGIYSGLHYAADSGIFCFGCDMPFLAAGLIKYMLEHGPAYDVFIPELSGRLHPLHAIYGQGCREPIREQLERGHLRIADFFPQLEVGYLPDEKVCQLDPGGHGLFNINTPQDLSCARKIARSMRHQ